MPTAALPGGGRSWQRRDRRGQLTRFAVWLAGTALFAWCWRLISEATTWFFVLDAPSIAGDILSRAVPPRWSYMDKLWLPLWDTLNIATLGTLLALVAAVPVAFLAARNTTPSAVLVRPGRPADHRFVAGGCLSGILRQIAADGAGSAHCFDNLARLFADGLQVGLLCEVFSQPHDQLKRVVNVMRDACGKGADARQFFRVKQFSLKIRSMTDQLPQQSRCGSGQHFRLGTFMALYESFDLKVSRDIHDQVHAMVVHEFFHAVDHGNAEISRPYEAGCPGVAIGNADDFNRRNQLQKIEESGTSSSGAEDRHLGGGKLRRHRCVRQMLHGMTPWMEGRVVTPPPTSYQRRGAQRWASSLCSMARATDSRSFSPSTGLTR